MSEIGFYHLTRTGVAEALPLLLARTLAAGKRALVLCGSAERLAALDAALWEADWLPHGTAADGDAPLQPIWLTLDADTPPNGARFLFRLDGAAAEPAAFDRVFDLFDGHDANQVAAARERWRSAKAAGHALSYNQQTARGWQTTSQIAPA